MKYYVGVTDSRWFEFHQKHSPEDVNFWQPGGKTSFKVIEPGGPFIFKLKSPLNAIGGVGFFSAHNFLPLSMAWNIFGEQNGFRTLSDFQQAIKNYRRDGEADPIIGCIVLTNPIFFKKQDWIPVPGSWSANIVQGKSYDTSEEDGQHLWAQIEERMDAYRRPMSEKEQRDVFVLEEPAAAYRAVLSQVRIGQGSFRARVIDAYQYKCAITGERTLPVLEAAHVKPYAESGPHRLSNGLLLRADLHKLFDAGYLTVNSELHVEVSRKIKEDFQNGREYYRFHGQKLQILPTLAAQQPGREFLGWHNQERYRG